MRSDITSGGMFDEHHELPEFRASLGARWTFLGWDRRSHEPFITS
jgi:hypothetical protein